MPEGRGTNLTPALQRVIVKAISSGVPRRFVADLTGVPERTLRHWIQSGREKKSDVFIAFFAAIKKAEAKAVESRIKRIEAAGKGGLIERTTTTERRLDGSIVQKVVEKECPGQWTADAWMLERCHPDEFALQRKKDIEEAVAKALKEALGNAAK